MLERNAISTYRITLADDHVLLRQGLRRIIEESDELTVVGEASDGLELLNLLNIAVPDMVVVDISMPNLRGLETISKIKSSHPKVKILVLTMHKNREYLKQAFSAGADGYLLKEDSDTDLFSAINKIRQGRRYVPPALAEEWAELFSQTGSRKSGISFYTEDLTTREREVLKLIAEGKKAREIAGVLAISVHTVYGHRANIMEKLRLSNGRSTASALEHYAITKGYI